MCLNELELSREMADLTRNNLFPSAKEVSILSLLSPPPPPPPPTTITPPSPTHRHRRGEEEEGEEQERPKTPDVKPRTKKVVMSLDANNPDYERILQARKKAEQEKKDFIQSNIV